MEMRISFPGGRQIEASFGPHTVLTDQPLEHGGDAAAPAPFDYFLASLVTCAGLYVLSFLEQRHLPTDDVSLVMETRRDPDSGMIAEVRSSPEILAHPIRHGS